MSQPFDLVMKHGTVTTPWGRVEADIGVRGGKISVDLTAHGPQRVFGIAGKGRISLGYDADFTIVDLNAQRTITKQWIASRCGWTPYDGVKATGWPVMTIVRGRIVMREDQVLGQAHGAPIRFVETL
jgi:dihydroorotase